MKQKHQYRQQAFDNQLDLELDFTRSFSPAAESRSESKYEKLALDLIDKVLPEGSDTYEEENVVAHLQSIGAWDICVKEWCKIEKRMKDKTMMEGRTPEITYWKIEEFRRRLGNLYSKDTVDKFLNAYGLLERYVNRAKHKKFLPDGSWISNGVRFGS